MREIILVGVTHGVEQTVIGITSHSTHHFEVEPPEDFEISTGLDSGDSVALEIYPGAINNKTNHFTTSGLYLPNDLSPSLRGYHYFAALSLRLNERGYVVQELDDRRLTCEVASKTADQVDSAACRTYSRGYLTYGDERIIRRGKAFIDFINTVLRENAMFANLSNSTGEVVAIGQAHAVRLASNEELQEKHGVQIVKFLSSVILPLTEDELFGRSTFNSELISPSKTLITQESLANDIYTELVKRKYNAYSIGRVMVRKEPEPDFIGMFNVAKPAAESLFELTITDQQGDNFVGIIKDVLGDANVTGSITAKSLEFKKVYDLSTVELSHDYVPIFYEGRLDDSNGQYEGRWDSVPNTTEKGYLFSMRKFRPGATSLLDKYNPAIFR